MFDLETIKAMNQSGFKPQVIPAIVSKPSPWKGKRENSLAIDVLDTTEELIQTIAAEIKAANEQESVLILVLTARAHFN